VLCFYNTELISVNISLSVKVWIMVGAETFTTVTVVKTCFSAKPDSEEGFLN
jgi:hypothetical protein